MNDLQMFLAMLSKSEIDFSKETSASSIQDVTVELKHGDISKAVFIFKRDGSFETFYIMQRNNEQ